MIEQVVERWHRFITGTLSEGLETLLKKQRDSEQRAFGRKKYAIQGPSVA